MVLPCNVALAADGFTPEEDFVSKAEATQFAEELKDLDEGSYDSSLRLIVSSNKQIDYLDAVNTATGIDDLYVLQFDDDSSAKKAEEYYKSLSYVKYVEYDDELENALCNNNTEETFDFAPNCYSTINQNIDDAIKLLEKENISTPEIRVGVIDSGVAKTEITESRIDGGYSYLEDHSSDGTQDGRGHGTKVASTIVLNTLDYTRLYAYQIFENDGTASLSTAISAIYLAVTDNCKIINCSFMFRESKRSGAMISAINYASSQKRIIVCAAGNESENLNGNLYYYPAMIKNCITVGATTQTKKFADFSNYGDCVDIYATGYDMV